MTFLQRVIADARGTMPPAGMPGVGRGRLRRISIRPGPGESGLTHAEYPSNIVSSPARAAEVSSRPRPGLEVPDPTPPPQGFGPEPRNPGQSGVAEAGPTDGDSRRPITRIGARRAGESGQLTGSSQDSGSIAKKFVEATAIQGKNRERTGQSRQKRVLDLRRQPGAGTPPQPASTRAAQAIPDAGLPASSVEAVRPGPSTDEADLAVSPGRATAVDDGQTRHAAVPRVGARVDAAVLAVRAGKPFRQDDQAERESGSAPSPAAHVPASRSPEYVFHGVPFDEPRLQVARTVPGKESESELHIGRIDVVVNEAAEPRPPRRQASRPDPAPGFMSRRYLRRV